MHISEPRKNYFCYIDALTHMHILVLAIGRLMRPTLSNTKNNVNEIDNNIPFFQD